MIDPCVSRVELNCVSQVQVVHAGAQPLLADREKQVVVVSHEDVGEHPPPIPSRDPVDGEAKQRPIVVVDEDLGLVVPAGDDVMEPRRLVAVWSGHVVDGRARAVWAVPTSRDRPEFVALPFRNLAQAVARFGRP